MLFNLKVILFIRDTKSLKTIFLYEVYKNIICECNV